MPLPRDPPTPFPRLSIPNEEADNISSLREPGKFSAMFRSRWFSRGWTLQELLAPTDLVFYSADWQKLGTKHHLVDELSSEVGIDRKALQPSRLESFSVASRMSWVSQRNTTRKEDLAYCLLGIFDVNMPLLYGEGGVKAFIRLQEEIIKACDDRSLFAWNAGTSLITYRRYGLLAESPSWFGSSGSIENYWSSSRLHPATVVNLGIKIQLPITDLGNFAIGWLNCQVETTNQLGEVGIFLVKVHGGRDDEYHRVHGSNLDFDKDLEPGWLATRDLHHSSQRSVETKEILVLHKPPLRPSPVDGIIRRKTIYLDPGFVPGEGSVGGHLVSVHPATQWESENYRMICKPQSERNWATGYLFEESGLKGFCLVVRWVESDHLAPGKITAFITHRPRRTSLRLALPVEPSAQESRAKTAELEVERRLFDVSTMILSPGIVAVATLKAEVEASKHISCSRRPLPKIVSLHVSASVVDEQDLKVTSDFPYIQLNFVG
jgi:hypothetical protein